MTVKPVHQIVLYLMVMIAFSLWRFNIYNGDRLTVEGDGGLIHYAITNNIQKVLTLDFKNWTNRRIFYPHRETLPFTDHFYLHSLIGLPYYILTRDPLNTYNFIYFVQLMIAATGYYLLARQLGGSFIAILFSGIYFTLATAFTNYHPQINFYGFLAWFVFFCVKFIETKKARYIYLSGLAYILQSLVGIYLQLFVFMILPFFLLFSLIALRQSQKIGEIAKREYILPFLLTLMSICVILFLVNLPYLEFKIEIGEGRPLSSLIGGGADLMDLLRSSKGPGGSGLLAILGGVLSLFLALVRRIKRSPAGSPVPLGWNIVWLSLVVFFVIWLFGLGPILKVNDVETGLKLPYYFLYNLHFVFRSIRVPARIWVLMSLPVSLLLLCLLEGLKRRYFDQIGGKIALLLLICLIVYDIHDVRGLKNYHYVNNLTYIYTTINQISGEVMVELPSGSSNENLTGKGSGKFRDDGYFEYMHIYHRKWTVNGDSGYNPPNALGIIRQMDASFDDERALQEIFDSNSIALVLIHRSRILPDALPNYEKFIMSLLSFGRIIHIDREYVLLAIGTHQKSPEKGKLREFRREWKRTNTLQLD